MTHREALEQIVRESQEYAGNRARFLPHHESALHDLHIYREGVRDGMAAAARVAQKALEDGK